MAGEAPVQVWMRDASTTKNEGINNNDDDDDNGKDAESKVWFVLKAESIKGKKEETVRDLLNDSEGSLNSDSSASRFGKVRG